MDYEVGRIGRVIVARGFDGENVYEQIESIARRENIRCASVQVVGGLRSGKVVCGPQDPADPANAAYEEFDDAREIAGVGTIFWDDEGPKLHLHGAIGRGRETLAGCPRGGAKVYCLLEVIISEIVDVAAERKVDPATRLKVLTLGNPSK